MKTLLKSYGGMLLIIVLFAVTSSSQIYAQSNLASLKKKLAKLVEQNQQASLKTKKFITSRLIPQLSNPVLIKAIKAQNSKGMSLATIKKIDDEWKEAEDELDIHVQMMTGACADELKRLAKKLGAVGETFATDNQGANVCQNALTGDFWQGDEAKWKNSFNGGKGGVDIGTEKLDRSSNMVLQQVSLPMADKNGTIIGAITYGVMTDRL